MLNRKRPPEIAKLGPRQPSTKVRAALVTRDGKRIGAWLRRRRSALLKISIHEAARNGSCSYTWLSQLERGVTDVTRIRIDSCFAICRAYQLRMDAWLTVLGVLNYSGERET